MKMGIPVLVLVGNGTKRMLIDHHDKNKKDHIFLCSVMKGKNIDGMYDLLLAIELYGLSCMQTLSRN